MRRTSKVLTMACVSVVLASQVGCELIRAHRVYNAHQKHFVDAVGKASYDLYCSTWGPPTARETISTGWVATWQSYDEIVLTFDHDGILRKWKVYVKR